MFMGLKSSEVAPGSWNGIYICRITRVVHGHMVCRWRSRPFTVLYLTVIMHARAPYNCHEQSLFLSLKLVQKNNIHFLLVSLSSLPSPPPSPATLLPSLLSYLYLHYYYQYYHYTCPTSYFQCKEHYIILM